jgi:hypothetical protein
MLHGYQAESELFRGFCDDLDDEEEEQKRRMAERAQRRTATASREPPAYAQPHISSSAPAEIRTVLEKEHEERRAARQRLLEKDERHQVTRPRPSCTPAHTQTHRRHWCCRRDTWKAWSVGRGARTGW